MKREKSGFTVVELLVVLGIIALLVGLLIPALSGVRNFAKETKQRGQFATIGLALTAFRKDYGDYPPSEGWYYNPAPGGTLDYCGAQKLAEALLGWDLLGFHPESDFISNGYNRSGQFIYDANDPVLFDQRKGPYLEDATTYAFKVRDMFRPSPVNPNPTGPLAPDTFVLCDVFGKRKIMLANGQAVKAGTPILYYRANTAVNTIRGRYRATDNDALVLAKQQADGRIHPLTDPSNNYQYFYNYIRDPKIAARAWPYRPESYILISAGADGVYGTGDDIRNFGK